MTNSLNISTAKYPLLLTLCSLIWTPYTWSDDTPSRQIPKHVCGNLKVSVNTKDVPKTEIEAFYKLITEEIQFIEYTCKMEPNIQTLKKQKLLTHVDFFGSSETDPLPGASVALYDNGELMINYFKGKLGNREVMKQYLSGKIPIETND